MKVIRIPAGIYAANCYIVYSETTKDGIIIDPGGDADEILKIVNENNLTIKYIILTHGHGDHIGGVIELLQVLKVPLLVHGDDVDMISNAKMNLSNIMPIGAVELNPDKILKDGGICIKIGNNLITGDTLFQGSIGRTDLEGGDYDSIIKSIKENLLVLPDDTIVWPGHGVQSTIGIEKRNNPFLK